MLLSLYYFIFYYFTTFLCPLWKSRTANIKIKSNLSWICHLCFEWYTIQLKFTFLNPFDLFIESTQTQILTFFSMLRHKMITNLLMNLLNLSVFLFIKATPEMVMFFSCSLLTSILFTPWQKAKMNANVINMFSASFVYKRLFVDHTTIASGLCGFEIHKKTNRVMSLLWSRWSCHINLRSLTL